MNDCPSEERLRLLLTSDPDATVSDALSRHVEKCASCQALLARLSGISDGEKQRRGPTPPSDSSAEDGVMRRLKRVSLSMPPTVALPAVSRRPHGRILDRPVVPGYEIVGELGRGGMGVVYEARQIGLNRTVALKMIRSEMGNGAKDLLRFRAEAAAIARLQHPNIVQIYDFGEAEDRPYFVLEFVNGGSLADHLDGTPQSSRPSAQLVQTLARAVHAAHSSGVVHRDLKPANILLQLPEAAAPAGAPGAAGAVGPHPLLRNPKIADFGLAKCISDDPKSRPFRGSTVTGELLGTPNYMSPEQATIPRPPIGPAADVYALGAILYELLTGRPPFLGETPLNTILQVLHTEPVSVSSLRPDVPRDLETICLKCLRKEPRKRYSSAQELAEDLQRYLQREPILARPVTPLEKAWRWVRRRPLPAGLLAAGLLAPIVAFVTLSLLSTRLVRSNALESAVQQAELLEEANEEYSRIVERVEQAHYTVNKMVPPTPGTVPLSVPATFMHDLGEQLALTSRTGVKLHQYSDYPFPWRKDGGPHDEFERQALTRLRETRGRETAHEFTVIDGKPVVRYAEARIMKRTCVECHNQHPQSSKKDWKEGDVRGVLVIIRPLGKDEERIGEALRLALLISAIVSGLLLTGSAVLLWTGRRRLPVPS